MRNIPKIGIFIMLFIGVIFVLFNESFRVNLESLVSGDKSEIDTHPSSIKETEVVENTHGDGNTVARDVLSSREVTLDTKPRTEAADTRKQQTSLNNQSSSDLSDSEIKVCYDFVFSDPLYKIPSCLSREDSACIEYYTSIGYGDMNNDNYKKLNEQYSQELNELYKKIKPIRSEADDYLDEHQYSIFFKNNSKDAFAKEILTNNSYVIEKITNFKRFDQFIILLDMFYGETLNVIARNEERVANFVPPTKKQEEEAIAYLEKSATLLDPDKYDQSSVGLPDDSYYAIDINADNNHPSLRVLPDDVSYSYTVIDGKVKASLNYPSSDLNWHIFPINEYRIAGNPWVHEGIQEMNFDLVFEDGKWKFDIWEPQRPGKEINPRILLLGLDEGYLEANWEELEKTVRQMCM